MKEFNHFAKAVLWLIVSLVSVSTYARLSDSKDYAPTDWIRAMSVNDNSLWLATEGGLVKFDTKTGETTIYNRTNAPIPEDNILSVACNGSSVWFGTRKMGVAKLEKTPSPHSILPLAACVPNNTTCSSPLTAKETYGWAVCWLSISTTETIGLLSPYLI